MPSNHSELSTGSSSKDIEQKCCDNSKHVQLYRCWRSLFIYLLLYFILCALTVVISQNYPRTLLVFDFALFGDTYIFTLPLLGLFAAVVLVRPLCLVYDAFYEIRCHHLVAITGLCSLKKKQVDLAYEDLRGVHVDQSIIDRLLNVGNLVVGSAMTGDPEIIMHGVPSPQRYAAVIMDKINEARMKYGSDQGLSP